MSEVRPYRSRLDPLPRERALVEQLLGILGRGDHELSAIVAGLRESAPPPEGSDSWTEEIFRAEMRRLGRGVTSADASDPVAAPVILDGEGIAADAASSADADRLVALGLRNRWYAVAPSDRVREAPVAMTRLGERLVVWRDGTGAIQVQQDQCPHRAAPLSQGRVLEGRLTCRYHGVQVDGAGRVVAVPAYAECAFVGERLVRSYPAVERFGAVWAWFGDALHVAPEPLGLPPEMSSPAWAGFLVAAEWQSHHQYIWDNLFDPMHTPYLHAATFTHTGTQMMDKVQIRTTETGFVVGREDDPNSAVQAMEYFDRGVQYSMVDVNYPPAAGPGGCFRVLCFVTPVAENTTIIHFWHMRQVSGWQRDLWSFLYQARLGDYAWGVLEQDRELLELMPPYPPKENLYQHDIGVARIRRIMRTEAERQAGAMRAASGNV